MNDSHQELEEMVGITLFFLNEYEYIKCGYNLTILTTLVDYFILKKSL